MSIYSDVEKAVDSLSLANGEEVRLSGLVFKILYGHLDEKLGPGYAFPLDDNEKRLDVHIADKARANVKKYILFHELCELCIYSRLATGWGRWGVMDKAHKAAVILTRRYGKTRMNEKDWNNLGNLLILYNLASSS